MGVCCCGRDKNDISTIVGDKRDLDNLESSGDKHPLAFGIESGKKGKEQSQSLVPSSQLEINTTEIVPLSNVECVGQHNSAETCRNELSDSFVCSSTTVDAAPSECCTFHRRAETGASTTWPDVSMPTASVRHEHPRGISELDTEEDFSTIDRSPTFVRERRHSFLARERERAALREVLLREEERRRVIIELSLVDRRVIIFRHYRGVLGVERKVMLFVYLRETIAMFLCISVEQETIARRLIEHEWQTVLLAKMQQHRLQRRRNIAEKVESVSSGSSEHTDAALHTSNVEEIVLLPEVTTRCRSLSAPNKFRRRQAQQNQFTLSLSRSSPRLSYQQNNNNNSNNNNKSFYARHPTPVIQRQLRAECMGRL